MKVLFGNHKKRIVFVLVILLIGCQPKENSSDKIIIDFWYGDSQEFGTVGTPQKWINILGNIQSNYSIVEASYQLNGSKKQTFSVGSDLHRLAATGDFNIDLPVLRCRKGKNNLTLFVKDSEGNITSKSISFVVAKNNEWPLPYAVEWDKVKRISDVVQVVDGHWKITKTGIRNIDTYYDRVLAFGDSSWRNYEVRTSVLFHGFTTPSKGPPTYEVSHAAIASRWPGHDIDSLQPHRKWYPLGATSEFRLTTTLDSCRWRVFDGPKPKEMDFYEEEDKLSYRSISLNKWYGMKHRVETIEPLTTRYSVKLWSLEKEEPISWDFIAEEHPENIEKGSTLLLAHNTEVTFGNIYVIPIKTEDEKP